MPLVPSQRLEEKRVMDSLEFTISTPTGPLCLPSVPFLDERPVPFFDERRRAPMSVYKTMQLALPNESGVYLVLADDDEVLYVGRAQHLKERWKNHHLVPALRSPGKTIRIAYWLCPVVDLKDREAALLTAYRPRLNPPWEIERATEPDHARPSRVLWAEIERLGKDARIAALELKQYGHCTVDPTHKQQYIVICSACLEHVWCAACLPGDWGCDCWKIQWDRDDWPWISCETYDALHMGITTWLDRHPESSIWDIDRACRLSGGNRMYFAAFCLMHHWPSLYEAEIFAYVLGTTLQCLEDDRGAH